MKKTKAKALKPFGIAGLLDHCPECGATGDYALLVRKVHALSKAWEKAGGYPDTMAEMQSIEEAIKACLSVIGKEKK